MKATVRLSMVLAAAILAGCGNADPETARLATGAHALAVLRDGEPTKYEQIIPIWLDAEGEDPVFGPNIGVGTRILVVKDAEKGEDNPMRMVVVKVEDGEQAGKSGKMVRWSLRASK
jgi:hypothetical protein